MTRLNPMVRLQAARRAYHLACEECPHSANDSHGFHCAMSGGLRECCADHLDARREYREARREYREAMQATAKPDSETAHYRCES